jgi:type I restriction enzyme, S subunit
MPELNGLPRLPSAWSWSTISDACLKVQDGTHFSPQNQLAQGAYRYITAKNVRPSGLDLSNVSYLAEDEHRTIYKRCDPKKGDVLLVKDGVNTGDAAVNTLDEEFSLLSSVCLLRPRPELLFSQFLRYYLLSPVGYQILTGQMTGTAIKRIILGRIKESPVPIAPLDEQRTIVAEIEKQFSRLDEAIANLKRVKANLKRFKAAVLKAAVEGKLTEDWRKQHPDVEPARKLLEHILAERCAKWTGRGKYKESLQPEANTIEPLSELWILASVDQLSNFVTDGDHNPPKRVLEGVPHLTAKHIKGWRISFEDIVPAGITFSADRNLAGIRLVECGMTPKFLQIVLNSPEWQLRMRQASGSTAQPHLYLGDLRTLPIPLPPLAEQKQIIAEVERRLSVIEELEAAVEANLTRADRLRQSILKRAFEGELIKTKPPQRSDFPHELSLAAESSSSYGAAR